MLLYKYKTKVIVYIKMTLINIVYIILLILILLIFVLFFDDKFIFDIILIS